MAQNEIALYDAVTLSNIPSSAQAVAGYVDGKWPTWDAVLQRWPKARHVSITVTGQHDADVCDCENGDLTIDDAIRWFMRKRDAGYWAPGIYGSLDTWLFLYDRLEQLGVQRSHVRVWTAHWTNRWHRCSTRCSRYFPWQADATQFSDRALDRELDVSAATTDFFVHHAAGGSPEGR